jgi:hypothetical protein
LLDKRVIDKATFKFFYWWLFKTKILRRNLHKIINSIMALS